MNRRLSSILVPIHKFLFPSIAVFMLLANLTIGIATGFLKDYIFGLLFLIFWGGFFYFSTRRWKNVYLRGNKILVSNLIKKIEIPVSEVRYVEASSRWGWSPRRITIKLKNRSEFGDEIVFVPRGFGFTADVLTEELKRIFGIS